MRKPSEAALIGTRSAPEFKIPSCSACMRIAARRNVEIGMLTDHGRVDGFTHADGMVQAVTILDGETHLTPLVNL